MKKVLVFVLAVMMIMSMAVPVAAAPEDTTPAAAIASPGATAADLTPVITEKSAQIVELHTTEDVLELHEDVQEIMAEAKEQLADACPEGFKVKYFFYVEITGAEKTSVSVDFESIVENIGEGEAEEDVKKGRLVFMQFVDGKWIELEHVINEDGTITVFNVVEGPISVFIK